MNSAWMPKIWRNSGEMIENMLSVKFHPNRLTDYWVEAVDIRTKDTGQKAIEKAHINPFPHTTILQHTTLNIFSQKIENLYNWIDNLWLKVENIVSKGEIPCFEQFLLLSLCFQKAVCCRGVRKCLYVGKGLAFCAEVS